MDLGIAGRTALVTGASMGIGRGIALALAKEGVRLAIVARRENLLLEVSSEIKKAKGVAPVVIVCDFLQKIRFDDDELRLQLGLQLFQQIPAARHHGELHAFRGERFCDPSPDPHARAGDERGLALDAQVHFISRMCRPVSARSTM